MHVQKSSSARCIERPDFRKGHHHAPAVWRSRSGKPFRSALFLCRSSLLPTKRLEHSHPTFRRNSAVRGRRRPVLGACGRERGQFFGFESYALTRGDLSGNLPNTLSPGACRASISSWARGYSHGQFPHTTVCTRSNPLISHIGERLSGFSYASISVHPRRKSPSHVRPLIEFELTLTWLATSASP